MDFLDHVVWLNARLLSDSGSILKHISWVLSQKCNDHPIQFVCCIYLIDF